MDKLEELYIVYHPMYFEKYLNDPQKYGERVKSKRTIMHLNVIELADRLGVSHSQISKIENGNTKFINLDTLNTLSDIFDCSPLYLLGKSDSENPPLENYCYTNPYTNNKLFEVWTANIRKSINRKVIINGKSSDLENHRMRSLIDFAKENKNGIKLQLDSNIYYFTYLEKKYYINLSDFRKERYVANKLYNGDKTNKIVKSLPNDKVDFFRHKDLNNFLVIQNCSDKKWLIKNFDNTDNNLLYHMKLQEIFEQGHGFYKCTNYNLIDYLFEINNIAEFNENRIIKHFSYLLHTQEFNATRICNIIDNTLKLNDRDKKKVDQFINKLLSNYEGM